MTQVGFSKSHDPAGTTTGPAREPRPPWHVWYAWYPVCVSKVNAAAHFGKLEWVWLGPVARRKDFSHRRHLGMEDVWDWEYAPAHFAITQEGR